ncbi:MAG: hypothetical protein ACPG4T_23835 [Nannocystaceae bacterium]
MGHLFESIISGFGRTAGENLWRFFRQLAAAPEPREEDGRASADEGAPGDEDVDEPRTGDDLESDACTAE